MIGFENELAIVDELIDTLDVEQQDLRTLRLYDIQHVDAQEVRNKLQELGIIGGERGARPAPTKAAGPAAPAAAGEGLVEEPQVVIIESTNSLLVNATSEQHIQIATIISYVDSVTLAESIPYEIYPLENQNPTDLAAVLEQLIQETVKDKEGKIQQVIKREENIEIVPDESTFSLIVYASKKNQEWIRKLIKTLDRRRPQVLIDVTLVAIDEADAFDYDLQLISKLPEMVSGGAMQKLANPLLSTFPSNTVKEISSILGDASPAKGFYADSHIQALLSIMQKKGYGRVLAKPKILVNDNELGHIDTTNTIYVSRSSSSVTTTGEATLSTSYTFDQFPSGVQLDITPHISEGDLLRLEIKMQRSSQPAPEGGIQANQPPPDKSENNINTIVTVPDDSTIILGGIITLEQTKDNWKVPLLGDIPVVGGLFRKINNNSRQSKLYIFVKANILRPSETIAGLPDLERISSKNRAAFEGFEGKFQKYQDWPGVDPEPMDPLRVLEAE
jgi:general secretion pathway protein D